MRTTNEAIFRRWIEEVWNNGDESAIDELLDKNAVAFYPRKMGDRPVTGLEEYKRVGRVMRGLFANISVTIEQITSDGNKVVSYCAFAAERRTGEDAPRAVKTYGLCQAIIADGKIVQLWTNIDPFDAERNELDFWR